MENGLAAVMPDAVKNGLAGAGLLLAEWGMAKEPGESACGAGAKGWASGMLNGDG